MVSRSLYLPKISFWGIYYLTRERPLARGEGKFFSGLDEVRLALDAEEVEVHTKILCRVHGKRQDTTVGRMLLSDIVPSEVPFELINRTMDKKALAQLVDYTYRKCVGTKKQF